MNLSHIITEFSFGPYIPDIVQPLDYSYEKTDKRKSTSSFIEAIDLTLSFSIHDLPVFPYCGSNDVLRVAFPLCAHQSVQRHPLHQVHRAWARCPWHLLSLRYRPHGDRSPPANNILPRLLHTCRRCHWRGMGLRAVGIQDWREGCGSGHRLTWRRRPSTCRRVYVAQESLVGRKPEQAVVAYGRMGLRRRLDISRVFSWSHYAWIGLGWRANFCGPVLTCAEQQHGCRRLPAYESIPIPAHPEWRRRMDRPAPERDFTSLPSDIAIAPYS